MSKNKVGKRLSLTTAVSTGVRRLARLYSPGSALAPVIRSDRWKSNLYFWLYRGCPFIEVCYSDLHLFIQLLDMETRDQDDVFLVSYPRTGGTTWVHNIMLGLKYGAEEMSKRGFELYIQRFTFLEQPLWPVIFGCTSLEAASQDLDPKRFLKTHLHLEALPTEVIPKGRKIVLMLRNPKDTAISYYHFYKNPGFRAASVSNLEQFLENFLEGRVASGSWWKWTKRYLEFAEKNPENILLLQYDDLKDNFVEYVGKLSGFLGFETSQEDIEIVEKVCSKNDVRQRMDNSMNFVVRKGDNSWKGVMSSEMAEKFDQKTRETFGEDTKWRFF